MKFWLKITFYVALVSCFITGNREARYSSVLITDSALKGIFTLQRSSKDGTNKSILASWQKDTVRVLAFKPDTILPLAFSGLEVAANNIEADYSFIVAYTLLLVVLLVIVCQGQTRRLLFPGLILISIGALADCFENAKCLQLINYYKDHSSVLAAAQLIWAASTVKFVCLAIVIIYVIFELYRQSYLLASLRRLSHIGETGVRLAWKFRVMLLSILILFAALWLSDQGQDLLLILNTSRLGTVLFLTVTSIWAALNWYLPKYYDLPPAHLNWQAIFANPPKFKPQQITQKVDMARYLGAITFLVPATCILSALQNFHVKYWGYQVPPMIILFSAALFFYFLIKYAWFDRLFIRNGYLKMGALVLTFIVIASIIVSLGLFVGNENRKPYFLAWLSVDLLLLSFAFLLFTTFRAQLLAKINCNFSAIVLIPGLVLLTLFLIANAFPQLTFFNNDWRFLTLPLVLSAIVSHLLAFTFLILLGKRFKFQLLTFLIVLGTACAALITSSFHEVHQVKTHNVRNQEELKAYIHNWLIYRRSEIAAFQHSHPGQDYPVFFLSSYGGGIKAAAWVSIVINQLDQLTINGRNNQSKDFQHYVLAYSGASGGAIGFSVNCASRYQALTTKKKDTLGNAANILSFYSNDFLSSSLTGMLGRDWLMASIGKNFYPDRSVLQEKNWETHAARYGIAYNHEFNEYWDQMKVHYDLPLLFANTYDIDSGQKGIACPVTIDPRNFPASLPVFSLLDKTSDLKMSTAAFLSARFPYVSPTGKITGKHHFADGGYRENSGTETLLEILQVFEQELKTMQSDSLYLKVLPHIIVLSNEVKGTESFQKSANLFEVTAPLVGLLNNRSGNASKADSVLRLYAGRMGYPYLPVAPTAEHINNEIYPVLPLGWQISGDALTAMKKSVSKNSDLVQVASFSSTMPMQSLKVKSMGLNRSQLAPDKDNIKLKLNNEVY
jgi:hypothetical protein